VFEANLFKISETVIYFFPISLRWA